MWSTYKAVHFCILPREKHRDYHASVFFSLKSQVHILSYIRWVSVWVSQSVNSWRQLYHWVAARCERKAGNMQVFATLMRSTYTGLALASLKYNQDELGFEPKICGTHKRHNKLLRPHPFTDSISHILMWCVSLLVFTFSSVVLMMYMCTLLFVIMYYAFSDQVSKLFLHSLIQVSCYYMDLLCL